MISFYLFKHLVPVTYKWSIGQLSICNLLRKHGAMYMRSGFFWFQLHLTLLSLLSAPCFQTILSKCITIMILRCILWGILTKVRVILSSRRTYIWTLSSNHREKNMANKYPSRQFRERYIHPWQCTLTRTHKWGKFPHCPYFSAVDTWCQQYLKPVRLWVNA